MSEKVSEGRAYAAHSGIQKGIRRVDLDLVYSSFTCLWESTKHRNWLKWRLPILAMEESWQLLGETAEFLTSESEDKKEWLKFLYRLAIANKSKDACALPIVVRGETEFAHREFQTVKKWFGEIDCKGGDPNSVFSNLYRECVSNRSFTEYEEKAVGMLQNRISSGGMLPDKFSCLVAIILISYRGLDKTMIQKDIEFSISIEKKTLSRPKEKEFPWYVYDMHTYLGKTARSIFIKKHMDKYIWLDETTLNNVWFFLESGIMRKDKCQYCQVKGTPGVLESIWWPVATKQKLTIPNLSLSEISTIWKTDISKKLEGIVNWLLSREKERVGA